MLRNITIDVPGGTKVPAEAGLLVDSVRAYKACQHHNSYSELRMESLRLTLVGPKGCNDTCKQVQPSVVQCYDLLRYM